MTDKKFIECILLLCVISGCGFEKGTVYTYESVADRIGKGIEHELWSEIASRKELDEEGYDFESVGMPLFVDVSNYVHITIDTIDYLKALNGYTNQQLFYYR